MSSSTDLQKVPLIHKLFQTFILFILAVTSVSGQDNQHQRNEQWLLRQKEIAATTVLLNNKAGIIPIINLEQKIASVDLGTANANTFDSLLNKYTTVTTFRADVTDTVFENLSLDLKYYNTVIVQVPAGSLQNNRTLTFLQDVQKSKQLVLVAFGSPALLSNATVINHPIIWVKENSPAAANFTAQLIFGGVAATGKLQAGYSKKYRKKDGFGTKVVRLKYTVPEDAGINISDIEARVDSRS